MQTLDIECPSCGEMLELDAGFAGGVCRCSNCGTLMTVPSSAGKAESLSKPTSSASVGAGGLSTMGVPDPGTSRGGRISTTVEAGEYRTASGKVIRVDETTRVPMAPKKKKQIRVATTIVFFSIIFALVVVAVIGIIAITGGPGGSGGDTGLVYKAEANPYTLDFANVMGLPVTDRTVIIVEASEYSDEWKKVAGDMVGAGLSQQSKDGQVALIGAGNSTVLFSGGSLTELPIGAANVRSWFEKLPAEGEGDVASAITTALQQNPDTLIVVHGEIEMSAVEEWDKLLSGTEGLKLHTIHIGNNSPELGGWAGEHDGEAVVLSIDQIETLKDLAAEAVGQE